MEKCHSYSIRRISLLAVGTWSMRSALQTTKNLVINFNGWLSPLSFSHLVDLFGSLPISLLLILIHSAFYFVLLFLVSLFILLFLVSFFSVPSAYIRGKSHNHSVNACFKDKNVKI